MLSTVRWLVAVVLGLLALLVAAAQPAAAQDWPQRSVKFIVPLGPGSGVDIGARLYGDRLNKRWNQPVVVENRPGGDALVAINSFVSANDDHVLLASPSSSFTHHPHVYKELSYKPSDLHTIARVSNTIIVIAVPKSLAVNSIDDLVTMARAEPGKLNFAGTTGALDFLFAGFTKTNGLQITKVPYRNPVEAANDLAADRIQVYLTAYAIARPQLQAGKIKLLAVTNTERAPVLPDLPTAKQAGHPELAFDGLVGFFGPPAMSDRVREKIAKDVREISADQAVAQGLSVTGQIPHFGGPAEFQAAIDEQRARLATIAHDLGIVPTQ
jgi:tripartite-type tricarboxylate transporter receptor subunit TctC